ncbi:DUF5994 family protein [Streptomyces sp. NPDC006476]|uniref:DUF5994 family protein n=1 Tax=Streptomyces sp. NPDC006476 TaxID=3157175 RepID=UPI0033A08AF9
MNAPTGQRAMPDRIPPSSLRPARLTLRPPAFPPGPVSGAWWPRSDDLQAELPALIEAFDRSWGRVSRVAAHRNAWPQAPCELPVAGHTVRAAWFTSGFDPHAIRLFAYGVGRRDLLVVPPGTGTATAGRLMTAAADPALRLTASALLQDAGGSRPARDM